MSASEKIEVMQAELDKAYAEILRLKGEVNQDQGEAIQLPERKEIAGHLTVEQSYRASGYNLCLDELAQMGPLYGKADPVQVAKLRNEVNGWAAKWEAAAARNEALEAKLQEAQSVLHSVRVPLNLRAEYDMTYLPESKPINDCAEAVYVIDTHLSTNA